MERKNTETGTRTGTEVGTVCVTGGTGYLGSWLVKNLLQQGYSVNATVRSDKGIDFLRDLPGASKRLKIFEADLNHPDSFRPAIKGCAGIFLVAHPMNIDKKLDEEGVTKLAVTGTLGILQACLDSKTVNRVVYTSSASTAMYGNKNPSIVDENTWSDLDSIPGSIPINLSYMVAKTSAERAALEFAGKHGLKLVTVLPTWIHGPFITSRCPGSVYVLMSMFLGDQARYEYLFDEDLVHVDDLANAHIFLMECPGAEGRYICSAAEITVDKLYKFLRTRYPDYRIALPPMCLGDKKGGKGYELSSKKLLEMGFEFKYGIEEMYDDALDSCRRLGMI